jgi:hypothetical protein
MGGSRFWEDIRGCKVSFVSSLLVHMFTVVLIIVKSKVGTIARTTASSISRRTLPNHHNQEVSHVPHP